MKKLFYGLGAIAAIATPIVAVVSCGQKADTTHSGKIETLAQVFRDAKLRATAEQLKAFEDKFGKDAIYEFEAVANTDAEGKVTNSHLVLIRNVKRLTFEQAQKMACEFSSSWNPFPEHQDPDDQLGGKGATFQLRADSFKGITLTKEEMQDKGFAYIFNTNSNGHIRVMAIVEDTNGNLCEFDMPIFAIDLTPNSTN